MSKQTNGNGRGEAVAGVTVLRGGFSGSRERPGQAWRGRLVSPRQAGRGRLSVDFPHGFIFHSHFPCLPLCCLVFGVFVFLLDGEFYWLWLFIAGSRLRNILDYKVEIQREYIEKGCWLEPGLSLVQSLGLPLPGRPRRHTRTSMPLEHPRLLL